MADSIAGLAALHPPAHRPGATVAAAAPRPPVPAPSRRRSWLPGPRAWLIAAVSAYLGLILVAPLAALALRAWASGLGEIGRALAEPGARFALRQSLLLVVIALVVNGVMGVAGAVVLVRHRFPGRRLFDALVDLPIALSPVMVGLAFLLVFGRGGWLEPVLGPMGVRVAFAFPGLVLGTLLVTLPYTLREVGHVLRELGTTDEEAAITLGASPWRTFWSVTLPNVRHGLGFGLTLTAARALGEFGAVLVIGGAVSGRTQTATTFIYDALEERQTAAGYGMAVVLAATSMLLLFVLERVRNRGSRQD
jgi:sulfate transport system permease protein